MVMASPGGWYAEVTPTRFGYRINICTDDMEKARAWSALTKAGAERKGRRLARRANAADERLRRAWRVRP